MRGRDKAPLQAKAEAKGRRYQPILKAVDDWRPQHSPRLTDFYGTQVRPEVAVVAPRKNPETVNLMK
jgi:hypothetical protein